MEKRKRKTENRGNENRQSRYGMRREEKQGETRGKRKTRDMMAWDFIGDMLGDIIGISCHDSMHAKNNNEIIVR